LSSFKQSFTRFLAFSLSVYMLTVLFRGEINKTIIITDRQIEC